MKRVRNISTGPRGAYNGGNLVMVDVGGEADADDFAPEWFEVVGGGSAKSGSPTAADIATAVEMLDPDNDEHWTKAGLPEVSAVKEALGADVTRAQIESAAPDAKRPE